MSEMSSVSFAGEIRRLASSLGRAPTDAQVADLEARARAVSFVDATAGKVVMNDSGDVGAFLARETNAFPLAGAGGEPATPAYVALRLGSTTSWRRTDDAMVAISAGFEAAHDAKVLAEIEGWPNPWAPAHLNRTRQTVTANKSPALAAKLKAEAGTA